MIYIYDFNDFDAREIHKYNDSAYNCDCNCDRDADILCSYMQMIAFGFIALNIYDQFTQMLHTPDGPCWHLKCSICPIRQTFDRAYI